MRQLRRRWCVTGTRINALAAKLRDLSLSRHLLSPYCIPGTVFLSAGVSVVNKTKGLCPHGTVILMGVTDKKNVRE